MGNVINCSTFLRTESGIRASADAVTKFKEELESYGKELIAKVKVVVEKSKRKTIQPDDFDNLQEE